MGLFSKKSDDSKTRIEELKKKIQAEQAAYSSQVNQPAPPTAPQAPTAPAPPQQTQAAPQAPPQPAPSQAWQQPPPMAQEPPRRAAPPRVEYYEEERPRKQQQHTQQPQLPEDIFEEEAFMEEIKTGIIIDLGDGMSLNLPIRSRMRLDEFLHIADRVRELQKVQHEHHQY